MSSVEKVVEQSLLYDYYGELLTKHQRGIYEAAVFENLSLGEIAEESGISRQGVHDLLRRCDLKLAQYEESLHLLEKHEKNRALCEAIERTALKLKTLYSVQASGPRNEQESAVVAADFSRPGVKEPQDVEEPQIVGEPRDGEEAQTVEEPQTVEEILDMLLVQILKLLEEI